MILSPVGLQGLLLHRDIWDERERRVRLRTFISTTILMLRSGGIKPPEG